MPLVPTRIDRYEIKGRLGAGGMGSLYLARDSNPTTDRLVVLKLLRTSFDSDEPRQRFAREARSLAELSHPNIVVIHDSGEFEDSPFIVMEYVRGETLAEIIRRRAPMSLGEKLRLLSELCAGLSHVHQAGIVHRDIKPANLAVDLHGRLKILDFGIARVDSDATLHAARLTQLAVQIGTPGYMPPEQIETGEVDWRGDLFAVGAVAYELLSGREAFPGANTRQVERQVLSEQPVPLVSSVPGLDPAIAEIIASALEKDVRKRCQSAAELGEAFDRARARLPEESHPPRQTPAPQRPTGERKSRRERAADLAYERAVTSYRDGAEEGARRFAMEAIAEQPEHAGARHLLLELGRFRDVEPWLPVASPAPATTRGDERSETRIAPLPSRVQPPPAPPPPQPSAAPPVAPFGSGTAVPIPAKGLDSSETLVVTPGSGLESSETLIAQPGAAFDDSKTLIVPGAALGRPPVSTAPEAPVEPARPPQPPPAPPKPPLAPPAALKSPQAGKPGAARTSPGPPVSSTPASRWLLIAVGVLAVVVTGAAAAWFLWPAGSSKATTSTPPEGGRVEGTGAVRDTQPPAEPTEYLLAIDKPTGGTVEGPGIACGTGGTDCSVNKPAGGDVTLVARADAGFTFGGFTGECTADGVAAMTAPRRCGAIFARASEPAPRAGAARPGGGAPLAQSWALTITRPTGGTILGDGIKCGTAGAECTAKHAAGYAVTLKYQADAGHTFGQFTGDCSPAGKTVMTAARICGATFVKAAPAAPAAPVMLTVKRPTDGSIIANGIDCGPPMALCASPQPAGTSVRLMARPKPGFVFTGYTDDCDVGGMAVMTAPRTCGATFAKAGGRLPSSTFPMLTVSRPRGGTLVGPGIECGSGGSRCQAPQPAGSTVLLRLQPDAGYVFVRFTGDCDAGGLTVMSGERMCAVSVLTVSDWVPNEVGYPTLTIVKPAGGTVSGNGIECGTNGAVCSAPQPAARQVRLLARPDVGFVFVRFTGDCDASGVMMMDGPRTCSATFAKGGQ
jgi:serine/threonine-protein kinase